MMKALYSGVAGLRTHQTRMDVIGNNIANVNTYSYKSQRATFRDVYYQTLKSASNGSGAIGGTNPSQIGFGSQVGSIDTLHNISSYAPTDKATDVFINGEGYFIVKDANETLKYTRLGAFYFDRGTLTDINGLKVHGVGVEMSTVAADGATGLAGRPNLYYTDSDGLIQRATYYDANAGKVDSGGQALPPKWALETNENRVPPTPGAGGNPGNPGDPGDPILNANGVPVTFFSKTNDMQFAVGSRYIDITYLPMNQDTLTPISITDFDSYDSIGVNPDGSISGIMKDGAGKELIVTLGSIYIAKIPNKDALFMDGNSYYDAGNNTGDITFNRANTEGVGGLITGGLEMSNVDLSREFTDMITTQRGFQANTKIISVVDEMLQELANLKR